MQPMTTTANSILQSDLARDMSSLVIFAIALVIVYAYASYKSYKRAKQKFDARLQIWQETAKQIEAEYRALAEKARNNAIEANKQSKAKLEQKLQELEAFEDRMYNDPMIAEALKYLKEKSS